MSVLKKRSGVVCALILATHVLSSPLPAVPTNNAEPSQWVYGTTGTPPRAPEAMSDAAVDWFLTWSPDGTLVVSPVTEGVGIFDAKTLALRHTIPTSSQPLSICLGARNEVLIGEKGSVTAFKSDGTELYRQQVDGTPSLTSSPNGLLTVKTVGETCEVLDTATGERVSTLASKGLVRETLFLGNQLILVRCAKLKGQASLTTPGWRVYYARKGTEWKEATQITLDRGRHDPIPCPDGGCYWVDDEFRVTFCPSADDKGRMVAQLAPSPFATWQNYFATPTGFLWVGEDESGPYVGRYHHGNEELTFERFELTDAAPRISTNRRRSMFVTFDGRSMITMTRSPGVERDRRLVRFDLPRAGDHPGQSFKGPPSFARKNFVEFGLLSYSLKTRSLSAKPRDLTPMSVPRAYSRTHVLLSDGVFDRKKGKFRSSKKVPLRSSARISDGGKYTSLTLRTTPKKTEVFSTHPRRKRSTFEASDILSLGPKGNTYAIERRHRSGSPETLIARKRNGDELWRVTDLEVRPVDVSPDGAYLCVESGILATQKGEWIRRFKPDELAANPRFNANGKFAVFVLERNATQWVWEFFDLEKGEVVATANFPVGAEPAAISNDARLIVARFGTLGAQRLYERK